MNILDQLLTIFPDHKPLDFKKQQTDYKIRYVKEYILRWTLISANRPIDKINFIDCMCNAGVYADGDLCTSLEVLNIFINIAPKNQAKSFNLFLNDYDIRKVESLKEVIQHIFPNIPENVHIFIDNKDVNQYLSDLIVLDYYFKFSCSTVLYVDPYDFGTVCINRAKSFIEQYYCELIFNFFTSDYVRNGIDDRIRKCIGNAPIANKDELIKYIATQMRTGKMKYLFSYKFKTQTNTELYQIIFVTPSARGLEIIKEVLWKVFNGRFYHKNTKKSEQLSFITDENDKMWLLEMHAKEAQKVLINTYSNSRKSYDEIEVFLIENSMLSAGQIISNVIKPLIAVGKLEKLGLVERSKNYKGDSYRIIGETDEIY